jgi:enoyl-CoA hydratase/carnithine racemase
LDELLFEINRVEKDNRIQYVILKGDGGKAFCTGADLKERAALTKKSVENFLDKLNDVSKKIEDSRIIYICAVDGYALGGGLEILLSCDFKLATEKSIFGLVEVRIGVIPGGGGSVRILNTCGLTNAKRIALLGEKFNAKDALKFGILHEVVKDRSALEIKVGEYIEILNKGAPLAISKLKKSLNYNFRKLRNSLLAFEQRQYIKILDTYDRREGIKAFEEKRKPRFKGR